jgi:predicted ester cyclase
MSPEENKVTVRRFYDEVITQKNLAVLDELMANPYVSHDLPSEREALKRFISGFHSAFPDGRIIIEQLIAEGDTVALRATFHGTQTGKFQDIPPTGKAVAVPAQDMYRLIGGKMVEHWGGPNQLSLLQQLGVIPSMG